LESHDPLSSFIFGRDARPVMGLCVDLNETRLAEAKEKLSAAGVDGVDLQHLALSPDPHALDKLLATAEARCLLPIDIFKVDVDSFDIELAVMTLSNLEQRVGNNNLPVAVIVEFNPILPPPVEVLTRFVRPMTEGPTNSRWGCLNSLSGAVVQLSKLGYRLHRLVYNDLVFVHERAAQDALGENFVAQDEWACYLENLQLLSPEDAHMVKHWLLSDDPVSLQEDVIRYCAAWLRDDYAARARKALVVSKASWARCPGMVPGVCLQLSLDRRANLYCSMWHSNPPPSSTPSSGLGPAIVECRVLGPPACIRPSSTSGGRCALLVR